MRRVVCLLLALALLAGLSACTAAAPSGEENETSGEKLLIVTTSFAAYDWTRQILGGLTYKADTVLLGGGKDIHSYQPSVTDIAQIASCDLFLYVGGESEEWVEDALAVDHKEDRVELSLMDMLAGRLKEEELAEGMEGEEEEEETAYDEHVWLSLNNAEVCCEQIFDALCGLFPGDTLGLDHNFAVYTARLRDLNGQYRQTVAAAPQHTLLFGDRFPFRYLVEDYGLDYYAAFAGCSAETEASFETVVFLAGKLDELRLHGICILEDNDGTLARTILETSGSSGAEIITMDSLQAVTKADLDAGKTYLSCMEQNLDALREALR